MLNWIFAGLIVISVLTAGFTGTMPKVTEAGISSAKTAVELAISLVGQMTLWLGFMGVLRDAGLLRSMARALKPVMARLFPEVPVDHPAMGAMIMNIAANMLGLGNAATPFGLKAMKELDSLNARRGISTNAMALFLVINTSGVAVLPMGVVAVRATLHSKDAAGIVVPSILGSFISTVVAVLVCKLLERLPMFSVERATVDGVVEAVKPDEKNPEVENAEARAALREVPAPGPARTAFIGLMLGLTGAALVSHFRSLPADMAGLEAARGVLSDWLLPLLMLTIVTVGVGRHVKVYESFIAAAKEGFGVGTVIIPFLVAILVAIGMFRASGAMEAFVGALGPFTAKLGLPAEALPMALIRPLSGSGALAVMTDTMKTYGPDSFVGYLVSLINGSSETTFYVLALYFGAVQVRTVRHTLAACLTSDFLGLLITIALCHVFFSGAP